MLADFYKHKIIDFVLEFMSDIEKDIKDLKIQYSARTRAVSRKYLASFD